MNRLEFAETVPHPPVEPEKGDFLQDGLLYCGKCGTARQMAIDILGSRRVVSCMCKCRSESYDREALDFAQEQEMARARRMKSTALQDPQYRRWTFGADDGLDPKMAIMRRYVENWDEFREKNMGLLLWGDVGTGKSFAAACIVNALTERCIPCLMTSFIRIANELTGGARYSKNTFIASVVSYPLLVIDDLGAERGSEYMQEMVFEVVDARYRSRKPLIITTNIPLDELKRPESVTLSRIYDRILEITTPVRFTKRRRPDKHEQQLNDFSAILQGGHKCAI